MLSIRSSVVFALACSVVAACGSNDAPADPSQQGSGGGAGSSSTEGSDGGSAGSATGSGGSSGGQAGASTGSGGGAAGAVVIADGGVPSGGDAALGDAGPSSCPAGAALCDDFEGDGLGAGNSPWKIETMNTSNDPTKTGKVELTTTKPAHGTHSVHIVIPDTAAGDPAGGSPAFISETKTFPALANDLWGRMLVFYTPKSALPNSHWVNVATVGSTSPDQMLRFGGSGAAKLNSNELPSDTFANSATVMPINKWVCFEWHVQAGTAASMHFYLNGTELTDMAVDNGNSPNTMDKKWHSVPFAKLQLGWEYWNGQFGGEMWLDDVAIGGARLTCPPLP